MRQSVDEEAAGGDARRDRARPQLGFRRGGEVAHLGAPTERAQQGVVDRRPHPRHLLVGSPRVERTVGLHRRAVTAHLRPHVVEALAGRRAARQHRRDPRGAGRMEQFERGRQLPRRQPRLVAVLAVGLVHRDDVGEFEDALLDPLQRVAGAGEHQHEERVGQVGHRRLRLADADRLHEHDVVAGRLDDDDRLPCRRGDPAERARRRRRTDERARDRPPVGPCGSCRRGCSRPSASTTDRPPARRPGARPRSASCRARR